MALFGRRGAEKEADERQQAARLKAVETAQSDFNDKFSAWFEVVKQAQIETGAHALTEEIISQVGAVPLPQSGGLLNDTQRHYMASYARSFCGAVLERQTISTVVAQADA